MEWWGGPGRERGRRDYSIVREGGGEGGREGGRKWRRGNIKLTYLRTFQRREVSC